MLKESRSEEQGAKKQVEKVNYDATTTTTTTTTTTMATEEPQVEAAMPQVRFSHPAVSSLARDCDQ